MLGHPSDCEICQKLRRLTLRRLSLDAEQAVAVQTWCRICGLPVFLEVLTDYEEAKRQLYMLDDQPQVHRHVHVEKGGWGFHWRFDEVLLAVFPTLHQEECWPRPPWYEHREAESAPVIALTKKELTEIAPRFMDLEQKMLYEMINSHPRTREELLEISEQVWDHEEVRCDFEVLGFKKPFAVAIDKRTGEKGSLLFQHSPRLYFGWHPNGVI